MRVRARSDRQRLPPEAPDLHPYRAAGAETAMKLTSMRNPDAGRVSEFIDDDELLEITLKSSSRYVRVL